MGILNDLFGFGRAKAIGSSIPTVPGSALSSPWPGASSIRTMIYSDHFGGELGILTRDSAIQVPPVAKAHSLITGVLSNLPLRALDAEDNEVTPAWLYTTKTAQPVWHRMAATFDDFLFYGSALWAVERDNTKAITDASHVPFDRWNYDDMQAQFFIDGRPVSLDEVLFLPGPDEGLLAKGNLALKGALANMRTWVGRAQNPAPHVLLHDTADEEPNPEEITNLITEWSNARSSVNGSVSYVPKRFNVTFEGESEAQLLIAGREADVRDVARLTNVPASLLDGSSSTASLTYSNSEGRRNELLDLSLQFYTAPLEARLSMDDVVPSGVRVRLDKSDLVIIPNPATDNPTED